MAELALLPASQWENKNSHKQPAQGSTQFSAPIGIGGCKARAARPTRGRPYHRPLRSSNRRQQTASRRAARAPPAKHKHNLIKGVALKDTQSSLGLVLVLSLARLLVDRPRGPPGAKRPLRPRCCASAAAPRCASLASCSLRSPPLPWVSFNATPCIKLCLCLAGGGLGARRLAVCC